MKMRTKVLKTYHCDICDTGYDSPKKAKACEKYSVEAQMANAGDRVMLLGERECSCGKNYFVRAGKITEITKPQSVPFGEQLKLYGRDRSLDAHPIGYIVSYSCPKCKSAYKLCAYSHEFTVVKYRETV